MKNQYVGDVGDFGKYGLLRFLDAQGLAIGLNWYLTRDDGTSPGRLTNYLRDPLHGYRDRELFEAMGRIVSSDARNVHAIDAQGIIPHATFFAEPIPVCESPDVRVRRRREWFGRSLAALEGCDLVYADPDIGLLPQSMDPRDRRSEGYILPDEVGAYFEAGHDVIYYCQRARRGKEAWEREKGRMRRHLADARVLDMTFHGGTQRAFVFVVHDERYGRYDEMLGRFMAGPWRNLFSRDEGRGSDPFGERVGEPIELETSYGFTVTLYKNGLGQLCAKRDDQPNTTHALRADDVARHLFHL